MARSKEKRREYDKRYTTKNKERIAAKKRVYREKNKERIAAASKAYNEKNKERIAAKKKEYSEKIKELMAASSKVYKANKERKSAINREYYLDNKEVLAIKQKKRRDKNRKALAAWQRMYRVKKKQKDLQKEFWKTVPFVYTRPKTIASFIPLKHGYKRNELIRLYFIKITRLPDEIFYKVGVTKYPLKRRYIGLKDGYYTRLSSAVLPAYLSLALESAVITKYSSCKYVPENFDGSTECFSRNLVKEFNKMVPEKYKEV